MDPLLEILVTLPASLLRRFARACARRALMRLCPSDSRYELLRAALDEEPPGCAVAQVAALVGADQAAPPRPAGRVQIATACVAWAQDPHPAFGVQDADQVAGLARQLAGGGGAAGSTTEWGWQVRLAWAYQRLMEATPVLSMPPGRCGADRDRRYATRDNHRRS